MAANPGEVVDGGTATRPNTDTFGRIFMAASMG